ncbi:MAG: hypothetical protein EOP54_13105 [Sphingobacteriales bacterium]|nr:MAG: hypothetical protein EOP54_13105 [Sphingobacteriales bacterium]
MNINLRPVFIAMSKSLTTLLLFSMVGTSSWAQNDLLLQEQTQQVADTNIYRAVTEGARTIGNWNSYLGKSLKFPKQFSKDDVSIRIIIELIVEKDGRLSNPKAVKNSGFINGKEASPEQLQPFIYYAFRVIINSPKWKPAINDDIIVRSYFTVPIEYRNY